MPTKCARPRRQVQLAATIVEQAVECVREMLRIQPGFGEQQRGAPLCEELGVTRLVVVDGEGERYEHRGHAGGRHFRHRQRAGPADDHIGPTVGGGHVVDEFGHLDGVP